jgi:HSP20 family protein
MELVKWNPARDFFGYRGNSLFSNFFAPEIGCGVENAAGNWEPKVDIYDDDNHIVLKAELPGVDKDKITIDVKDRVLTLKGERSEDSEVKKENYYRREMFTGTFTRAFVLPENVNPDDIRADYKDGVLKVDIPKPEERKPRKITVH